MCIESIQNPFWFLKFKPSTHIHPSMYPFFLPTILSSFRPVLSRSHPSIHYDSSDDCLYPPYSWFHRHPHTFLGQIHPCHPFICMWTCTCRVCIFMCMCVCVCVLLCTDVWLYMSMHMQIKSLVPQVLVKAHSMQAIYLTSA